MISLARVLETLQRRVQGTPSQRERGAILVEYGYLFVLIVLVAVVALTAFGGTILDLHSDNSSAFSDAASNVGN